MLRDMPEIDRRRELTGLCTGTAINSSAVSFLLLLVPLTASDLGATPRLIGVIQGLSIIGAFFMALPSAILVRRIGTRRTIIIACFITAGLLILYSLLPRLGTLVAVLTIFNMVELVSVVARQGHVAQLRELSDSDRGSAQDFGWYGFATGLGQFAGPLLGGFLIEAFGFEASWSLAALPIGISIVVFRFYMHPRIPSRNEREKPEAEQRKPRLNFEEVRSVLSPLTLFAMLSSFTVLFCFRAWNTYLPLHLKAEGITPSLIGIVISVRAIAAIMSRLLLGVLLKKTGGPVPTIILCQLVLVLGIIAVPVVRAIPLLAASSFVAGVGMGIPLPVAMAIMAESVPAEKREIALSMRLMGNRLANLTGPIFFGLIAGWFGIVGTFWTAGAILAGATFIFVLWARRVV